MYKLGHEVDDTVVEHSHPPLFERQVLTSGIERLVAGVPRGDPEVLRALADNLNGPLYLLYVLHTPRGEGEPGRYESPELDHAQIRAFLRDHAAFLAGDGRFDLWILSPDDPATLAWDRHNFLSAYGPLDRYAATLRAMGFFEGPLKALDGHMHYYRQEFDAHAAAVLAAFDWYRKPLRPEDEQ